MVGFFLLVWLVTFIAFIVYWWKKRKARLAAGENYQSDPIYQKISKTKRIIGAVCIVSFILSMAVKPEQTPEEKARIQARKEKNAAEKAEKEAQAKIEKQKQIAEKVNALTGEDKTLFDSKVQEYKRSMEENDAKAKALADVEDVIAKRVAAAEKAKKAEEARLQKLEKERKAAEEEQRRLAAEANKYQPINANVLYSTLKGNAARANRDYSGKYVKIMGAVVDEIESEGSVVHLGIPDGDLDFSYIDTFIRCYPKTDVAKKAIYDITNGQRVTVYGKVTEAGEFMGYYVDVDKFEW